MLHFPLQNFIAHGSKVNCLEIGRKSKHVIVTGGEDQYVNLWRVEKTKSILSCKHQSAVMSVTFDKDEQKVAAGSHGGSIKIYDLNAGKVSQTLIGHKVHLVH